MEIMRYQPQLFEVWRQYRGTREAPVAGASMSPTLEDGDRVVVEHVAPGEIRVGDIVVAAWRGALVIHRVLVIRRVPDHCEFVLKGDRSVSYEVISEQDALGRVTDGQREGRSLGLSNPALRRLGRLIGRVGAVVFTLVDRKRPHGAGSTATTPGTLLIRAVNVLQQRASGLVLGRRFGDHTPAPSVRRLLAGLRPGARFHGYPPDSSIDWDTVAALARRHRVAPLLYSRLSHDLGERGEVPHAVMSALQLDYYATGARNLHLFARLKTVAAVLRERGVDAMVLKGPVLATLTYRNPAVRPIADLDLLVRESDYETAVPALETLGFRAAHAIPTLTSREVVDYAHYFSQIRFIDQAGIVVEIHFRLINLGVPAKHERLVWERSAPFAALDPRIRAPSMEDMLVHLCLHAAQHNFHRLLYLCDAASVLDTHGRALDWDSFIRVVSARRMTTLAYYVLTLCGRLLGAETPPDVLATLRPRSLRAAAFETIWRYQRVCVLGTRKRSRALEPLVCYLAELDGPVSKLWFVLRACVPRAAWLSARYRTHVHAAAYPAYLARYLVESAFERSGTV
jgi:hypothetical protein